MTQPDLKKSKYQEHIKALEEHKKLLEQVDDHPPHTHFEQTKASLEKLAITLEEYFKVIGLP